MYNYTWIVELGIKEGQKDEFRLLAKDMVADIKANEPNTLTYEFYVNSDHSECHIYERYADGDAFTLHLSNFEQKFATRFGACVDITRFTVYGTPDDKTKAMLDGFGAIFMPKLADD